MEHGFQALTDIVPEAGPPSRRLGHVSRNAFRGGALFLDTVVVSAVRRALETSNRCLLVGRRHRGKTTFAKTFGLAFLDDHGSHGHVFFADIRSVNVPVALEFIRNKSELLHDEFLFIIDDCHVDIERSLRIMDGLHVLAGRPSARVLLTTRSIGHRILSDDSNAAWDLHELGLSAQLEPGRDFLEKLARRTLGEMSSEQLDATVRRLQSVGGDVAQLGVVNYVLEYALATKKAVPDIDEREVYAGLLRGPFAEASSRQVLLRIAALNYLDQAAPASYVESSVEPRRLDALVGEGLIQRETPRPGYTGIGYSLDEPSQAEVYIRACEVHDLLGGVPVHDFVLRCAKEAIAASQSVAVPIVLSVEAEYGPPGMLVALPPEDEMRWTLILRTASLWLRLTICWKLHAVAPDLATTVWNQTMSSTSVREMAEYLDSSSGRTTGIFLERSKELGTEISGVIAELSEETCRRLAKWGNLPRIVRWLRPAGPDAAKAFVEKSGIDGRAVGEAVRDLGTVRMVMGMRTTVELGLALEDFIEGYGGISAVAGSIQDTPEPAPLKLLKKHAPEIGRRTLRALDWDRMAKPTTLAAWEVLLKVADDAPHRSARSIVAVAALYDWKKELRPGALRKLNRVVYHAGKVSPEARSPILTAVAGLDDGALDALLFDPRTTRRDLSKALIWLSGHDRTMGSRVAGLMSGRWLQPWMNEPSADELRTFLYVCLNTQANELRSWIDNFPPDHLEAILRDGRLQDTMWCCWSLSCLLPAKRETWVSIVRTAPEHAEQWNSAAPQDQFIFQGICRVLLEQRTPAKVFRQRSAQEVVDTLSSLSGPAAYCFAICGLYSSFPDRARSAFANALDRQRLLRETAAMQSACPAEMWPLLKAALDEILSELPARFS